MVFEIGLAKTGDWSTLLAMSDSQCQVAQNGQELTATARALITEV